MRPFDADNIGMFVDAMIGFSGAKANPPEDAGVLATRHFADAYAARTGCGDRMNPFVAPDWYEIDASQVLLDEMPPEPVMPEYPKPRRSRKKGS